ncbi:MAG TPA: sterol desaturase family protein [Candidatus Dormibacteraeota bacterium]
MSLINPVVDAVAGFVVLFGLFAVLESLFPERRDQPRPPFRRGTVGDAMWWFADYAARAAGALAVVVAIVVVARFVPHPVVPGIALQPAWLQFIEVLVISDLAGYWGHRAFHRVSLLWRFHAVHHSIEEVDWLSAGRVHPIDTIVQRPLEVLPVFLLGFSSTHVLPLFAFFIGVYPIFLHANVRWDYGPLRLVIASPAFHRWHHTAEAEGIDKNYAALFPWIDWLFGSLHFPRRATTEYGLGSGQHMRDGFFRQLLHPLRSAIRI